MLISSLTVSPKEKKVFTENMAAPDGDFPSIKKTVLVNPWKSYCHHFFLFFKSINSINDLTICLIMINYL